MAESLMGMMKEIAQQSSGNIITCTVLKTSPLQLKFQGDANVILDKDCLIVPAHVNLSKGNTAYVIPNGETYFVLGKG